MQKLMGLVGKQFKSKIAKPEPKSDPVLEFITHRIATDPHIGNGMEFYSFFDRNGASVEFTTEDREEAIEYAKKHGYIAVCDHWTYVKGSIVVDGR